MFFQIDTTPEHVKRKRANGNVKKEEDVAYLKLEPFSLSPTILFENVVVGQESVRVLNIFNPKLDATKVFVTKKPDELGVNLSWYENYIEPKTESELILSWCPQTAISQRFSMQICDKNKGRYEVTIVCKSIIKKANVQKHNNPRSNVKKCITKPKTKSPKNKYLVENIRSEIKFKKSNDIRKNDFDISFSNSSLLTNVTKNTEINHFFQNSEAHDFRRDTYLISSKQSFQSIEKENFISTQQTPRSPKRTHFNNKQNPDLSVLSPIENFQSTQQTSRSPKMTNFNVKQNPDLSILSAIENLQFTPGKNFDNYYSHKKTAGTSLFDKSPSAFEPISNENVNFNQNFKLHKNNHKIDLDFDHTIENLVSPLFKHPFPSSNRQHKSESLQFQFVGHTNDITSVKINNIQPCASVNCTININTTTPIINISDCSNISKIDQAEAQNLSHIHPKTTSNFQNDKFEIDDEKLFQTPNNKIFDLSNNHILPFDPKRCSTERKSLNESLTTNDFYVLDNNSLYDTSNNVLKCINSETFTKGDSPIIPLNPDENEHKHSSPYSLDKSPITCSAESTHKSQFPRSLFNDNVNIKNFNERENMRNLNRERNNFNSAKSIIGDGTWTKSPPLSPTPLSSIPEEPSVIYSEVSGFGSNKKVPFETFILNRTYETQYNQFKHNNSVKKPEGRKKWNKISHNQGRNHKIDFCTKFEEVTSESKTPPDVKGKNTRIIEKSTHTIDIYTVATTIDPFLASTCLYDEEAFDRLECEFKRWLNYLLTPPSDLDTKLEIDAGKAWIDNRSKKVPAAPTKEQVSLKYNTSHRLESLRKTAKTLIKSVHISQIFLKVTSQIERKILSIRTDKNLHLDIGLQKIILRLLLCYNPLWLRIGLEALYDKPIPLTSNDDICGLSDFIIDHMFRDPYVNSKYILIQSSYAENIKKFTLKKFLFLVYFLDQAKQNKIIFHDPCLFCRNAPFKESKQILFEFTKELLSGVGDITKHLKPTGYIVSHKQTYLNEFKYAVHNLAVDLKDGIRLTRLMEIILVKENLIASMRTPAISRLQKIHNVQVALTALETADFKIVGDITAKDIADGHREKTLSLLWQLIHKFRAPLFENASIVIQKWWKHKYLKIFIKNKIENRKVEKLSKAATVIQSWWKSIQCRKQVSMKRSIETNACKIIQKNWRMWKCMSEFNKIKKSTIIIQRYFRRYLLVHNAKIQLKTMRENKAAIKIQQWYKKAKNYNLLKSQNTDRKYFLDLKFSVLKIQNMYRANAAMKRERKTYITLKTSTIKIQRFYRTVIKTRIIRKQYLLLKSAVITIQNRFRANTEMKMCENVYKAKKSAAITLQKYYRNYLIMKKCKEQYLNARSSIIFLQTLYRNKLATRNLRNEYLMQRQSAITIQRYYRSYRKTKAARDTYLLEKNACIIIQRRFRSYILMQQKRTEFLILKEATITIQQYYRAKRLMESQKTHFLIQKNAAMEIQRRFRSYLLMQQQRREYLILKEATVTIQQYYRAKRLMECQKAHFLIQKNACIIIQRRFRSYTLMQQKRTEFLILKEATITIQRYYRAKRLMVSQRAHFLIQKNAATKIQRIFRSYSLMQQQRREYLMLKEATITIQKYYRAKRLMECQKAHFLIQKNAAMKIQRRFRNYLLMQQQRREYLILKEATIIIQRYYRAKRLMETQKTHFLIQKNAAIKIQTYYRSYLLTKSHRNDYLKKRQLIISIQKRFRNKMLIKEEKQRILTVDSVVKIQKWYRSIICMRKIKNSYVSLKLTTVKVQRLYRNKILTRTLQQNYYNLRNATICLQRHYRAKKQGQAIREEYLQMKNAAIVLQKNYRCRLQRNKYLMLHHNVILIQKMYRNNRLAKDVKSKFDILKSAVIFIQRKYRARQAMLIAKKRYLELKQSAVVIQTHFRALRKMKYERNWYVKQKKSVLLIEKCYKSYFERKQKRTEASIIIQRYYRSYVLMKANKLHFDNVKVATTKIQQYYRAWLSMKYMRNNYLEMKKSALTIQRYYRAYVEMKKERCQYLKSQSAALKIQRFYRNYKLSQLQRSEYLKLTKFVTFIQRQYRAKLLYKKCRYEYLVQKRSVTVIQNYFRSYLLMKETRKDYLNTIKYVNIIQQKFKSKLLTRKLQSEFLNKKQSAIMIQSYFRMYICKKRYLKTRNAAITIQQNYRRYNMVKVTRTQYLHTRTCIIHIQSIIKKCIALKRYRAICRAALLIQRKYRERLQRIEEERMRLAAIKIQTFWRAYNARRKYLQLKRSVVFCQTQRRSILNVRKHQESYKQIREKVIMVQAVARGFLSRQNFKATKSKREKLIVLRRKIKAVILIQSYWRGYKVRKVVNMSSPIKRLRLKRQQNVPQSQSAQLTIAERNNDALDVLYSFKDIASVIRAFKTLDFITSVYPTIYSTDETAGAITRQLILYMGAANRSVSTLETLQLGVNILINLTLYNPTAHFVYNHDCVDTILLLLSRWCGKNGTLSCSFCTLLWLFGKYDDICKDLAMHLQKIESYKMLCKIRSGIVREKRMESNKRSTLTRNSLTPMKSAAASTNSIRLPMTNPSYGIVKSLRPKTFQDEIFAIDSVFSKYNLPLNSVNDK